MVSSLDFHDFLLSYNGLGLASQGCCEVGEEVFVFKMDSIMVRTCKDPVQTPSIISHKIPKMTP